MWRLNIYFSLFPDADLSFTAAQNENSVAEAETVASDYSTEANASMRLQFIVLFYCLLRSAQHRGVRHK